MADTKAPFVDDPKLGPTCLACGGNPSLHEGAQCHEPELTRRAREVLAELRTSGRSTDADLLAVMRDGQPIVRDAVQTRCKTRQSASRVLGCIRTRGAELGLLVSRWRWDTTPLFREVARLLSEVPRG